MARLAAIFGFAGILVPGGGVIGLIVGLVSAVVFHVHLPGAGIHSAIFSKYFPAGAGLGAAVSVLLGLVASRDEIGSDS
jgi:hypothetical protein